MYFPVQTDTFDCESLTLSNLIFSNSLFVIYYYLCVFTFSHSVFLSIFHYFCLSLFLKTFHFVLTSVISRTDILRHPCFRHPCFPLTCTSLVFVFSLSHTHTRSLSFSPQSLMPIFLFILSPQQNPLVIQQLILGLSIKQYTTLDIYDDGFRKSDGRAAAALILSLSLTIEWSFLRLLCVLRLQSLSRTSHKLCLPTQQKSSALIYAVFCGFRGAKSRTI